jgi:predicted HicB family RNase H-like nuclease
MGTLANVLEYKGYLTKIEYSTEDQVLHGKIEGIADLVTFESDLANEIEKEFRGAVDDYLLFCEEMGKEPDKSYKGSFNVRIAPELHKAIAMIAYRQGFSLNETVEQALNIYANQDPSKIDMLHNMLFDLSDNISYQASDMWEKIGFENCKDQFSKTCFAH